MLKNFITLFLRNLRRHQLFSLINLSGLTISMVCTILIVLYVSFELSYDNFHPHAERLYRVNQTFLWGDDGESQFTRTGPGVAHALKAELPEIEVMTSLHTPGEYIVTYVNEKQEVISFEETEVLAADTNFFSVFNFPMIKGNQRAAFREENTLMMTRSAAAKYFGTEDPIGKLVQLGGTSDGVRNTFEVTGILEDVPENSTIQFDVLLPMRNFPVERLHWSWVWTQLITFVRLAENADLSNVEAKLKLIPAKHAEETLQRIMNISFDEYVKSGKKWELFLQPITTSHLPKHPVVGSFSDIGNIKIIYSLIGAAVFILLLSCFNFMNLSAAQFTRRIKETGIKKILGLGRVELSMSYLLEAVAFCLIALLLAIALTQILLPSFNLITERSLSLHVLLEPSFALGIVLIALLMALISSSYPAVFLSQFKPVEAIKGKLKAGREGKMFRNGLVVFQFAASIILIVSTAIVFQQLNYVSDKDLGFDKNNLIELKHAEGLPNTETFIKEIEGIPGVEIASSCSSAPPNVFGGDSFTAEGLSGATFALNYTEGDEQFIPALGIKLKIGRNFSRDVETDRNRVIVNETTIRKLGWTLDESVIGKKILYPNNDDAQFEIVGVVSDFNYWSLATSIEPMAIFHINNTAMAKRPTHFVVARLKTTGAENMEETLSQIQGVWKKHAGTIPFQYGFVDDSFNQSFKTHEQFGKILVIMAILAVVIACLGLLGIIIYSLEHRTKEIGIRKVSGATVLNILTLIYKSQAKLVLTAFVIGAPVSFYLMSNWLKDFPYRITPSPWIYAGTGALLVVVMLLITGYHSIKAALTNPVNVLKDE